MTDLYINNVFKKLKINVFFLTIYIYSNRHLKKMTSEYSNMKISN